MKHDLLTSSPDFTSGVVKQLEDKLSPERVVEQLLIKHPGEAGQQFFSGDRVTLPDSWDTLKILEASKHDIFFDSNEFQDEVLAILDLILLPKDAPGQPPPLLPMHPSSRHTNNRKPGS
ncbi:hypothetical protein [Endozoicomonas elysicola]|uniref:Uncharacterized protein n=1 Tax=Endozoicomonas elysicola TaxID=305900 RepID=A0A081K5U2_9GAMM|nr:hypothetical protein [Endozoicomonas elysicola]KEI69518.1 hypothetical protein GV64_01080 [Endozoicomonas elysicola]